MSTQDSSRLQTDEFPRLSDPGDDPSTSTTYLNVQRVLLSLHFAETVAAICETLYLTGSDLFHYCGGMLPLYVHSLLLENVHRRAEEEEAWRSWRFCQHNARAHAAALLSAQRTNIFTVAVYQNGCLREPLTSFHHILVLIDCNLPQANEHMYHQVSAANDARFAVFVRNDLQVHHIIVDDDLEIRFTVMRGSSMVQVGVIKPQDDDDEETSDAVVERVRPLFEREEDEELGLPLLFIDPASLIKDVSCNYVCDHNSTVLAFSSLAVMAIEMENDEGRGDHLSIVMFPRS